MKELYLPENTSSDMKDFFKAMRASIEESSKKARGQIFTGEGVIIWEEPVEEYEQRMKELNK